MNNRKILKSYEYALRHDRAVCSYCNALLTASDKVTVIGNQSKSVVHFDCAILESEP